MSTISGSLAPGGNEVGGGGGAPWGRISGGRGGMGGGTSSS